MSYCRLGGLLTHARDGNNWTSLCPQCQNRESRGSRQEEQEAGGAGGAGGVRSRKELGEARGFCAARMRSSTQRLCAVGKAGHGGFRLKARVTDSIEDMGRRGGGGGH